MSGIMGIWNNTDLDIFCSNSGLLDFFGFDSDWFCYGMGGRGDGDNWVDYLWFIELHEGSNLTPSEFLDFGFWLWDALSKSCRWLLRISTPVGLNLLGKFWM